MARSNRPFVIKKRVKGFKPGLLAPNDQQTTEDTFIRLKTLGDDCKAIVLCTNGDCQIIAKVCSKRHDE